MSKREVEIMGALEGVQTILAAAGKTGIDIAYYDSLPGCQELGIGQFKWEMLGLHHGESMFLVSKDGMLLYAVNVTADATLTAAWELLDLLSRKF